VGGTLSVGGIGGMSHLYGMQTDNVLELNVVVADGRELTCSATQNTDLFNAVRAGLGQVGIITRATSQSARGARLRAKAAGLLDGRLREPGRAGLEGERALKGVPGSPGAGTGRVRLVVTQDLTDRRAGDAELDIGVEVRVVGRVDLRDQRLV